MAQWGSVRDTVREIRIPPIPVHAFEYATTYRTSRPSSLASHPFSSSRHGQARARAPCITAAGAGTPVRRRVPLTTARHMPKFCNSTECDERRQKIFLLSVEQ
jgi:hypothetical protein